MRFNSMYNYIDKQRILQQNKFLSKDGGTQYKLSSFEFDAPTRMAKFVIDCTTKYRTVEKYITQNYEKYPVYSNWKYKTKQIRKTLKLTNENIENLNNHNDELVRLFAEEIILSLNDHSLIPSWLMKKWIESELKKEISKIEAEINRLNSELSDKVSSLKSYIDNNFISIDRLNIEREFFEEELNKAQSKLKKAETSKGILLIIFTFGIYSNSKRKAKLSQKIAFYSERINITNNTIQNTKNGIGKMNADIEITTGKYSRKISALQEQENEIRKKYQKGISEIRPLPTSISNDNGFVPLKNVVGMSYEKITGCYVIHNIEKSKYYVGQSKDVMKRLKQHFKGTVPNNIIFAEDYYSSKLENKENLFEVRIIPLHTKDELDAKEKELIEFYDSFNNGYNGTSGNT